MSDVLPVTVIVRTIGRPPLLVQLLNSLRACAPRAAEVVIVDQSRGEETAQIAARYEDAGVRLVRCDRRGRSLAANVGLAQARYDVVAFTDDDCFVAPDWVAAAHALVTGRPELCVTGRLLPVGDPRAVPSSFDHEGPIEWTGQLARFHLYASNMACDRDAARAIGFDEHLDAMEDWDFGLRWMRSGRRLRFEPAMTVWHDHWREPEDVEATWVEYGEGCGRFYAKLLRARDPLALRFIWTDVRGGLAGYAARAVYGRRWWDPRPGILAGLGRGLRAGLLRR